MSVHAKRWQLTAEQSAAPDTFNIASDPKKEAKRQFGEFVDAIGAEIVSATDSPDVAAEVMKRYFGAEAPFEANEKKKHEFPDAFALLSLEQVASEEQRLILCVSADKGWQAFADKSDHLVCVDEIDKALSFFNEADAAFALQIVDRLRAGNAASLQVSIESAIQSRLDDNDFEVEARSGADFEAEQLGAAIQQLRLNSISDPVVIAEDAVARRLRSPAHCLNRIVPQGIVVASSRMLPKILIVEQTNEEGQHDDARRHDCSNWRAVSKRRSRESREDPRCIHGHYRLSPQACGPDPARYRAA